MNLEGLTPIVIFTLANAATLVAFYVTARVRNAVLPGLAVLAGVGVALILEAVRRGGRRPLLVPILVLVSALILGLDGEPQREDRFGWSAAFHAGEAQRAARAAKMRGAVLQSEVFRAVAACWRPEDAIGVDRRLLGAVALKTLTGETSEERRFDLAITLQNAGEWSSSEAVLDPLSASGYRPRRENRSVSSVAFYQARAALRRKNAARARQYLGTAARDAPGDPYVLALRALLEPLSSRTAMDCRRELEDLHDPFTASLAMASAQADAGNSQGAGVALDALARVFPEWKRPRAVAAIMR